MPARFLKLTDVCEVLNISMSQAYALVNSGDLRGIQVGGRNQWRVEDTELEAYIQRMYAETRERIARELADEDDRRSVDRTTGKQPPADERLDPPPGGAATT
ncbi:helix-turn-helix domain-containing protein [Actinotalea sp. M2MS4P-6]|uniref:helix-turn-helix domain-containing protein n=1 Tax=Actinotalea sp. M2MS4P-6 TaxID=2983762 RepID=UPI0021E4C0A8|nr:helix-turn-helix domain-containing protein [Actinotalea sp. M2MS4P-6]MCV2394134.1 helix-turn-helix domain-containing protein [Actinotalea sp. M2MS4P-6]